MEISEEIEIRREMEITEEIDQEIEIRGEMEISKEIEITNFHMINELIEMVRKEEWDKVIDIYSRIPYAHKAKITKSGDTALHMAVYRGKEEIAMKLIEEIIRQGRGKETLEIKNDQGNTPLHAAASMGYERMCQRIVGFYPSLVAVRNVDRETPISLAAFHDKKEAFLKLLNAAEEDISGAIAVVKSIKHVLFHLARKEKWDEVVHIYEWTALAHKAKITKSGDTALHIAVSDGQEEKVKQLVHILISNGEEGKKALKIQDEQGNTPLHVAASVRSVGMCEYIAQVDPSLVAVRNKNDETPFFVAALHGQKEAFLCLLGACESRDICEGYSRRKDGETILHVAVAGGYFDLAYQIIHLYPDLANSVNLDGVSPLHVLAGNPSNFKSGSHLGLYYEIIYHCILVDRLDLHPNIIKQIIAPRDDPSVHPPTNAKCIQKFLENFTSCIHKIISLSKVDRQANNKGKNGDQTILDHGDQRDGDVESNTGSEVTVRQAQEHQLYQPNYITNFEFLKFPFKAMLVICGLGPNWMRRIVDMKQKHAWSVQIMNELVKSASSYEYDNTGTTPSLDSELKANELGRELATGEGSEGEHKNGEEKGIQKGETETPILIAAKNGIIEIVEKILNDFPFAIHDVNTEKKNIVLLAVENRQPHIYQFLLKQKNLRNDSVFQAVDNEGNTALHLAAKLGDYKPWLIPGAALQMQWEVKWYEFVKKSKPPHFFLRYNNLHKTPEDLFTESHKELVKEGGGWLNKTSEACSVVAALIATVAFATSTDFPGGVKEKTGTPKLVEHPAFSISAISSALALCLSVTAVVMFLAVLTSRYEERDFGKGLPKKLLLGLTSLFLSIASVLVSFCAGDYFVLKDNLKRAVFPVYAAMCLPITFYAVAQLPLYLDLVWATFKTVPQRRDKAFLL